MQILGFLKMCLSFLSIIPEFACKQFDHFLARLYKVQVELLYSLWRPR